MRKRAVVCHHCGVSASRRGSVLSRACGGVTPAPTANVSPSPLRPYDIEASLRRCTRCMIQSVTASIL
eukprot:134091-Pyramimonas_sp.AAC.2